MQTLRVCGSKCFGRSLGAAIGTGDTGKSGKMAGVLFVHNNFPAQFGFIAEALRLSGENVAAIGSHTAKGIPGVPTARWIVKRGSTPNIFRAAARAEADLMRATGAIRAAKSLKESGFEPDLIIGHPGWGETLFLKEVWPNARVILHAELFYRSEGGDSSFDPEFGLPDLEQKCQVIAKNSTLAWAYTMADRLVSPTPYQAATLPENLKSRTAIIHEGVDIERIQPTPDAKVALRSGVVLDRSRPIITFVNRVIEPLRGCHIFFRALPQILKAVPNAEIVIVGAEVGRGYGAMPPEGETWKSHFWKEIEKDVDASRVHFVGRVPNNILNELMSISVAHVYWTYPFVLSWSLLEAMACEALVIASDTAPVRDVIRHGENGLMVDFFRPDLLAESVISGIRDPEKYAHIRGAARQSVMQHFDRKSSCLPGWLKLIREVRGTAGSRIVEQHCAV